VASRSALGAVAAAGLVAAGCNGYEFSPVGHCLVQPGATRVRLSAIASADILFVVDDSPSMDPKQAGLAASFGDFIGRMVATNTARVSRGLEPIDFHIAVTTSSVFLANPSGKYCQSGSGGDGCCAVASCADAPGCTPGTSTGCAAGELCVSTEVMSPSPGPVVGEKTQCCAVSSCAPAPSGCRPGDPCASMVTGYASPTPAWCTQGITSPGAPYGRGAFVAASGNPLVLDFEKTLDWASWGTAAQDPALTALVRQFEQNIEVGSCGSGEEQHLEAARLAMQSALAGKQPGVPVGSWPHPGAKLVIVWVGDEDDCSSPASAPVVLVGSQPGADSCVWDKHRPAASQRETPVGEYAKFFSSLVRKGGPADFGAAFIVSAVRCADGSYAPADACSGTATCPVQPPAGCNPPAPVCGEAYAAGERFFALSDAIQASGYQVVEGTVCDAFPPATFGSTLAAIADLARPPSGLKLETQPASTDVTIVRVVAANGDTVRVCTPGTDWCFVSCTDSSATPACLGEGTTSQCIALAAAGACQADPGQTYSAEYLGMVPEGGCATAADCDAALGGGASAWTCYTPAGQSRGTCLCGS
jgi:hypothetical protein